MRIPFRADDEIERNALDNAYRAYSIVDWY